MRAKNVLLVIASLIFYAYGEPVYVLLMIASSLMNYAAGVVLGHVERGRKAVVACAVVANLAMLVLFKYADMLVATVNAVLPVALPSPQLALPVGISFFTFQALSYVIDVYRREVVAQRNFLHVLLYISLFPQLIAGPIVKYHDVEAQIGDRRASVDDVAQGLRRFCFGLAKKVLIANNVAIAVDALFAASPQELNVIAAWTAALAYMVQIYFDFSGYSDMAIGLGRMFGFRFKENFNYPYVSCTVQEFWRRWHISLSTWFKEYLYIPLGGNRKGRARTNVNKLTVFFLCGLWHGANWTFVIWGLIHGAFLMLENMVPLKRLPRCVGHLYTLLVVCLAFVLFRADSLAQGAGIIAQMFTGWSFDPSSMLLACQQFTPKFLVAMAVAAVAATPVKARIEGALDRRGGTASLVAHGLSYVLGFLLLALCLMDLSSGSYNPFIYFRF
ncbi:MBOAT family protein [Adlercreutzia sp. ZJ473]|uniref:MBOAT family O-acyltransferase n=1 Tax=Adlercreutzia sp. ZJ473 TaxID=2722822 RepID=UPI001C12F59B|nr:MBOAT family protein [Adlercreutzia sp. ZJ473]